MPTGCAIKNPGPKVEAGVYEKSRGDSALVKPGEDIAVKIGMTFPCLRGDEVAIDHALFIHPLGAGLLDLEPDIAVAGESSAFGNARGDQNLDAVADGENPFALLVERPNELQQLVVVPEKLRCAAADQQDGGITRCFSLAKCDVRFNEVARTLNVGVPAGLEVVNDSVQSLLFCGTDVSCPPLLLESVLGVENLVRLAGIIRNDQNFFAA